MNNNKLNVKDLINIGLFSVLIFIALFAGGMLGFIPVLMTIVPFVSGVVAGPVYMLYSTKIHKKGMLFTQQMILALVFLATGHGPWIILTSIVAGILGEYILKKGEYKSINYARKAFSVSAIYFMGNWIPVFLTRDAFIKQLIDTGYGIEYANKLISVLPNWSFIPLILSGVVGTYIGCSIGIKMLKKHFVKAGMIAEV